MIFNFNERIKKIKLDNKLSVIRTIIPISKRASSTIPLIISQIKFILGKDATLFTHKILNENINKDIIKINQNISIRSLLSIDFTSDKDNSLYKSIRINDIDSYNGDYYYYYLDDETVLKSSKRDKEGNITDESIRYMYIYLEL